MTQERVKFKPEDHFRNLKGSQYLDVRWRVCWFRDEHPDGYIKTELVEHDATAGLAVFKTQAGFFVPCVDDVADRSFYREVYATGYGSETRKDFADYLEKSETKSVGRALALLGYGTAQAIELDEEDRIVDSPVERKASQQRQQRAPLAVVPEPVNIDELRAEVTKGLEQDAEAAAKLPKPVEEMTEAELSKSLAWLTRRARALSS